MRWRRRLAALIVATAGALVLVVPLANEATAGLRDLTHTREGPCPIAWRHPYYSSGDTRPVRILIRCAVLRWSVPGGVERAFDVARCESGFRPDAYYNGNGGVLQHRLRYWPGRVEQLLPDRWEIGHGWSNARANVIVGVRYAHLHGWGSWSCA